MWAWAWIMRGLTVGLQFPHSGKPRVLAGQVDTKVRVFAFFPCVALTIVGL